MWRAAGACQHGIRWGESERDVRKEGARFREKAEADARTGERIADIVSCRVVRVRWGEAGRMRWADGALPGVRAQASYTRPAGARAMTARDDRWSGAGTAECIPPIAYSPGLLSAGWAVGWDRHG
jgi:hypothetical protein